MMNNKIAWMIYDKAGLARNQGYVKMYEEICQSYGVAVKAVLDSQIKHNLDIGENPAFVLVRTIQPDINLLFEKKKIPVFNSSFVSSICNHKGKTIDYLKDTVLCVPSITIDKCQLKYLLQLDFESVKIWFADNFIYSVFAKYEKKAIETTEDFVCKVVDGHGGTQVYSLRSEPERIISDLRCNEFVIQPMIRSNTKEDDSCVKKKVSRDMRVYVIGTQIVAAVLRSSDKDFRANYSLGGDTRLVSLEEGEVKKINKVIEKFDFGMAGIDYILDEENCPWLNEIEDVVGARMLYQCAPEINIAKKYVEYILNKLYLV